MKRVWRDWRLEIIVVLGIDLESSQDGCYSQDSDDGPDDCDGVASERLTASYL